MEDLLKFLIEQAQKAGPFAAVIMTTLWYLERNERIKFQSERNALLERMFTVTAGIEKMLDKMLARIGGRHDD